MRHRKKIELAMTDINKVLQDTVEKYKLSQFDSFGILESIKMNYIKNYALDCMNVKFDGKGNYIINLTMDDSKWVSDDE